ncbi:YcgN family cysteine cluster protein [Rhodobacteraceae bacterium Araon29]
MTQRDRGENSGLSAEFWKKKSLAEMSVDEWEALCDGCGKCCLNKIEDEDSGEVFLTRVACRLFDNDTCRCSQYSNRHQFVPECISLTPDSIPTHAYWLPKTCAYLLLWQEKPLFDWHPLISGSPQSVHQAGISIQGQTVPEFEIDEDDWEHHLIEEQ